MTDSGEYRGKTFKSGNSVALRLPKGLGVPEGTEVRMVREEHMLFRVEPLSAPKRKIDISKFWGTVPELELIKPEDRIFEPSPRPWDDPDWPGWGDER